MSVKYIDPEEFREEGYLQEVNRRFLHPLGLAIEVFASKPGEERVHYALVTSSDLDYLRSLLPDAPEVVSDDADEEVLNLVRMYKRIDHAIEQSRTTVFRGVWDYRDDPEGMNFAFNSEDEKDAFANRADNITKEWRNRRRARVEALGYFIQPYGDHFREIGSDIVALYGRALGEEMNKVVPVKATSESWQKAARGVLDKICETFSGDSYNPQEVTPEEVHLIDLLLGPEGFTGVLSRAEAVNHLVDERNFWKEHGKTAAGYLGCIARGDIPPGMTPQEAADQMLSELAADLGG